MRKVIVDVLPFQREVFEQNLDAKIKIVPKGRRLGFTFGSAVYVLQYLNSGIYPILWGDTIHANIERYVSRYFIPLAQSFGLNYKWEKQNKTFTLSNGAYCDFRSADNPENWEGFGYRGIILNEAGIILKNRYIWENAVRPMLLDYKDSFAIIGGTPKGKYHKGEKALYYELWEKAQTEKSYWTKTYSTYNNISLSKKDIATMEKELPNSVVKQEIYGEFIENESSLLKRRHIKYYDVLPDNTNLYMGVDLAISDKKGSDYTAISIIGKHENGNIYIVDVFRFKEPFHRILEIIEQTASKYKPKKIVIETVQFQTAIVQELLRNTKLPVKGVRPDKSKDVRFFPLLMRYEAGFVYHSKNLFEYENEVLSFPDSEHDDMVDAAVYAYLASDIVSAGWTFGTK